MNNLQNILDLGVLLAPVIALLLIFLIAIFWLIFAKHREHTQALLSKLEAQLAVLTNGSVGMGKKLLLLEQRLARLQESQSQMQHSNVDFSFTQAQRLMTEGLPNEAIAANSGLSSSEINLMRLLHSRTTKLVENA